jgi:hypothetical protein
MNSRKPGERPAHVKAPAHLSKSPPVPVPAAAKPEEPPVGRNGLDPTRYGDWEHSEHGGRIIDF